MVQKKVDIYKPLLSIIIPVVVIIILFAAAVNVGIISIGSEEKIIYKNIGSSALGHESEGITATVIIDFGDGNILTNNIVSKNITAYGLLLDAAKIENIDVKATYYGQYDSIFVDSISSYSGGDDNRYWIYYVNSESGMVGADKYIIKNNDIIEWKFEKSIY